MTRHAYDDGRMDDRTVDQVQAEARARLKRYGLPLRASPAFETHDHSIGAESCQKCSQHDHTDTTPFGFTVRVLSSATTVYEHHEPVPAWFFICPKCGQSAAGAEAMCDLWTSAGGRWRRAHPFREEQPMEAIA